MLPVFQRKYVTAAWKCSCLTARWNRQKECLRQITGRQFHSIIITQSSCGSQSVSVIRENPTLHWRVWKLRTEANIWGVPAWLSEWPIIMPDSLQGWTEAGWWLLYLPEVWHVWFALIYYSSEADDFICLTEMMSGQTFTDCSAAIDETTEKGGWEIKCEIKVWML